MKRIMLAFAAIACLSVPALADEEGPGPEKAPIVAPVPVVDHYDHCGHGPKAYDKFSQHEDWGRGFHDRKFDRDGYGRW